MNKCYLLNLIGGLIVRPNRVLMHVLSCQRVDLHHAFHMGHFGLGHPVVS